MSSSIVEIPVEDIQATVKLAGYKNSKKITDTLQGSIWRSYNKLSGNNVVIKATNKTLHSKNLVILDGVESSVFENILHENIILKYLTTDKLCPTSIIKYYDSFQSNINYYLVMEDGGQSLFEFVERAHICIKAKKLQISQWIKMCKIIFKQMVESIEYIHNKNVSHFDISLENYLINDVQINVIEDDKFEFCFDAKIQCKLCDFGLASYFSDADFITSKYCGKANYKSPEIVDQKQQFNAKANDIWCVGVCLLKMLIGIEPWNKAQKGDICFNFIIDGQLDALLKIWKKDQFVDEQLLGLFNSIFQYEENRINIEGIKKCSWFKSN